MSKKPNRKKKNRIERKKPESNRTDFRLPNSKWYDSSIPTLKVRFYQTEFPFFLNIDIYTYQLSQVHPLIPISLHSLTFSAATSTLPFSLYIPTRCNSQNLASPQPLSLKLRLHSLFISQCSSPSHSIIKFAFLSNLTSFSFNSSPFSYPLFSTSFFLQSSPNS